MSDISTISTVVTKDAVVDNSVVVEEHVPLFDIDRPLFEAKDGRRFRFVRYISPNFLFAWEIMPISKDWTNQNTAICRKIKVNEVDVDILKALGVWDGLGEDVKAGVVSNVVLNTVKKGLEEKAINKENRESRRAKYDEIIANIPSEVKCSVCNNVVETAPSIIAHKIEKSGESVEDYLKGFKCKRCGPVIRRGRAANPDNALIPKEMVCKCGKIVKVNIYALKAKAEKLGTSVDELIKGFVCQVCVPTKGKPKKV